MPAETYSSLKQRLQLQKDLPYTPDWSAAPDFLEIIAEYCLQNKPEIIVECSSGLTTLVLARCCQLNGRGHVSSMENGEQYAARTRSDLDSFKLAEYATVIHAPLENQNINMVDYTWYNTDDLPGDSIDMLVIDGPPGFIQKHSRYPALPRLFDKLADNSIVYIDDADRADEKDIIRMWLSEYGSIRHELVETERGCSVLKVNKAG